MKRREYQRRVQKRRFMLLGLLLILILVMGVVFSYCHGKNNQDSKTQEESLDQENSKVQEESLNQEDSKTSETEQEDMDLDPGMIFNTQKNELGSYRGGTEGDQTGKEARIMNYPDYYVDSSYPWSFMLRCTDEKVRKQAVTNAIMAAGNDHIGYDSGDLRMTLWDQVEANNYDFSRITTDCSANCVTSALIFYKAAGYQLGIEALQNIDISIHVWDVNETLLKTGLFEECDDSGYLHTSDHGLAGDLYVAESRHVMMQVSDGKDPW